MQILAAMTHFKVPHFAFDSTQVEAPLAAQASPAGDLLERCVAPYRQALKGNVSATGVIQAQRSRHIAAIAACPRASRNLFDHTAIFPDFCRDGGCRVPQEDLDIPVPTSTRAAARRRHRARDRALRPDGPRQARRAACRGCSPRLTGHRH